MSTFDGLVHEFPDIRIDYFRSHQNKRQPAACFLSHIHSDHLLGLETLKMPFVYCSAATRQLLLKMEKYPHRINFSKGILESRKQTYKHLKMLLRPLPLQTPVTLELRPNYSIKVTLFDANHCPGAVMFLIESVRHAILYTGDIRAETWWVNSIVRNPLLIPYTNGQKILDCLYLDTTFASHRDIYREFPTKAEGLAELLEELTKRPDDSIFYFRAWTLGYEDVWITMSSFLKSQVHVDRYQLQLFRAIAEDGFGSDSGPALAGFQLGNDKQPGCLTTDANVRIHSCEPGMPCHSVISKNKNIVWITPIISRTSNGTEIAEVGAGGGRGDLYQSRELDIGNDTMFEALKLLISNLTEDQDAADSLGKLMQSAHDHQDHRIIFDSLGADSKSELSLKEFVKMILKDNAATTLSTVNGVRSLHQPMSNTIHFPYSRHSSYSELCGLVRAFRPKDICPCTVDLTSWTEEVSIESLFGDSCSGSEFRYDHVIREEVQRRHEASLTTVDENMTQQMDTQQTETQTASQDSVEILRTLEECRPLLPINAGEGPLIQVPITREEALHKFRNTWQDMNSGSDMYKRRLPIPEPPLVDDLASQTTETDTLHSGVMEERGTNLFEENAPDNFEDVSGLSDLSGSPIRPEKRQVFFGDGAVLNIDSTDEMRASFESRAGDPVNIIRRREAYEAAEVCLTGGDPFPWNALNIRSLRYCSHQDGSPEF